MEDFKEGFRVIRQYWREFLFVVLGSGAWLAARKLLLGMDPGSWLYGGRKVILSALGFLWFGLVLRWFFRQQH